MCGISGYVGIHVGTDEATALIQRMCESMCHRGPDDFGYWSGPGVGLGMRRLAIIDVASGHQPMATEDGRYKIVFNGEIYNYRELRSQLEVRGCRFRTASDTEVLLRQFEVHGVAGLHQLNGMFAFAVWDTQEHCLWLVRDRMGVKPLYYHWDGQRLIFASEIKGILSTGIVERGLNDRAIWDYLTFRYVPGPQTVWRNIFKLQPGHFVLFQLGDREPVASRYWRIEYLDEKVPKDDEAYDAEFRNLLSDAVRIRLRADVPVGIALSGGIDSSVVAALASQHTNQLKTFSIGFAGDPSANELAHARIVSRHIASDHHEVEIGMSEFVDFLPRFVRYTDEPLADLASIPLHYVCRLASEKVKVALSGEGADEVLGGYDFELRGAAWDRQRARSALRRRLSATFARRNDAHMIPTMTNYMDSDEKSALMLGREHPDSLDSLLRDVRRFGTSDPLHQVLYGYSQHWLVEDLLMKADKMSMANSIELRTPFLDYRLVTWAARTPAWVKVGLGEDGRYLSKRVLRRLAQTLLPIEIVNRPKQGFPVSAYDWLGGPLHDWARELLDVPDVRLRSIFDGGELKRHVDAGLVSGAGVVDRHRLWNLLILELWMREWMA